MFWLDRNRGQPGEEGSGSSDSTPSARPSTPDAKGRKGPAPHVVISGRQLREEILSYGPAFLEPHRFSEPDAFRALVTVLAAYALGSRTAARLVRERQVADPTWQPPSRREAMQVVSSLNRLRQYLPYLLGQRMQVAAGAIPAQHNQSPSHHTPAPAQHSPTYPPPPPAYQQPSYTAPPPPPPPVAYQAQAPSYPPPPAYPAPSPSYIPPPPPACQPAPYQQTPPPQNNHRATEVGVHGGRTIAHSGPPPAAKIPRPIVNARPAVPRASGVLVRPVISLNNRRT